MAHIMVDLETLGTGASAIIIAIGAVKFDLKRGTIEDNGFYASVSVESNLELGRKLDESTLLWWMRQAAEAQQVFFEPKMPLTEALTEFADWLGGTEHFMWGNGPAFDLGKVADAFGQLGMEIPWNFWNERCVRTYRALPGAEKIPKVAPQIAHHALHDAAAQAQHMINIHQALFGNMPAAKNSMVKA